MAAESCTLFLTSFLLSLCLASSVPVISWWNGESASEGTSNIVAGHTLLKKEFQAYFEPFTKRNDVFVVFLQDQLSIDDFTRYGGSFPFIRSSIEANEHVVMPSVTQHDGSIVDYLSSLRGSNIIEISLEVDWKSYDLASKLKDGMTNLVVLKLEPVMGSDGEAKESILKRNDELMKTASSTLLKTPKSFVMIYTSESQAEDVKKILINEQLENTRSLNARHLLANTGATGSKGRLASSDCVALYLRGLEFGPVEDGKHNLTEILDVVKNETKYDGDCNDAGYYSIVLKTDEDKGSVLSNTQITINLQKINNTLEWGCFSIEVKGEIKNDTGTVKVDETIDCGLNMVSWKQTSYNSLVSPLQYSFACSEMRFVSPNQTYAIAFKGIQIQPFKKTGNGTFTRFHGAYNCEGFFTLPILTGLLVGFLLIASLFMGTTMMMNIQTQARFDDPKGKTITVAAQE